MTQPEPQDEPEPVYEHPDDRDAYAVFANAMGWAVSWWDLGTERDIAGPGKLPFVLAFRHVRQTCHPRPACQDADPWAEWVKMRERQRAGRDAVKGKRKGRRGRAGELGHHPEPDVPTTPGNGKTPP